MITTYISGRQTGKTTKLIDWLLAGEFIPDYPGWSRVIVCVSHDEVIRLTRLVRERTTDLEDKFNPRTLTDLRKAIWSIDDLRTNQRGASRKFKYAVDDAERLFEYFLRSSPEVITMTGKIGEL